MFAPYISGKLLRSRIYRNSYLSYTLTDKNILKDTLQRKKKDIWMANKGSQNHQS